jgi:hypothetical protein
VTADPLSKSAKIEKARGLGKRILLESVLVAMTGEIATGEDSNRPPRPNENLTSRGWPAGWYADPWGQPCFRFWDGASWTERLAVDQ